MRRPRLPGVLVVVAGCASSSGPAPSPSPSVSRPEPPAAAIGEAPPASETVIDPGEADPGPIEPVDVVVPGDRPVHVVAPASSGNRALVYLPGRCGDDQAFRSWRGAAARWGTLVVVLGDERCDGSSRYRWGTDLRRIDGRIGAALHAVSVSRGATLDSSAITLIGYSEGATRAEGLIRQSPERYRRAILAGAPKQPQVERLRGVGAVVVIAGELDRRRYLEEGADDLVRAGVPATFRVLPGAAHGEYGPEGERVMSEALAWLFATAP